MARTRKTDPVKDADKKGKATPKGTETAEQAKDALQEQETAEQGQDDAKEQDQGNAKEQETAEQDQGDAKEKETAERDQGDAQEKETAERDQGDAKDTAKEQDVLANLPNPCVYCGPSVPGVARQYTTYQGGIPDELRRFLETHPEALALVVSFGRFQDMHKRLETPGTPEAELYKRVKRSL